MAETIGMTGNDAAAEALRQINPDVVAAYPITPQTELMHRFAEYVADGKVDTEFVRVESEHSAQSAVVGASLAGARCCTATSSAGLALMWEILFVAASCRCPIVMPVVNRALSAPINIHCDHSDTMGARDCGWIQLYAENVQEAYDNILQAVCIAEHPDVRLPVMAALDGFILSHTVEAMVPVGDKEAKSFMGGYSAERSLLDVDNPMTFGAFALYDYYFEFKKQQQDAMDSALAVVPEVGRRYGDMTGRSYGLIETYRCENAEAILVGLGSSMGTAKEAADRIREEEGIQAGVVKIRCFRPFPEGQLSRVLTGPASAGVLDRSMSFGLGGPLFHEVRSACRHDSDTLMNFIYGLGGRDLRLEQVMEMYRTLVEANRQGTDDTVRYIGVRE